MTSISTIPEKTKTSKSIRNGYLVAFILLFISYLVTLYVNRELVKQADRVEHTNTVIKTLDNILGKVTDGETGVRGYIITKNIQFLFPYYGSRETTDSLSSALEGLVNDNPVQGERLQQLKSLMGQRFAILQYHVKTFDENNREMTDSMRALQYEGKKLMDGIRTLIALMEREENRLLTEREDQMKQTTKIITAITIISLTLAFSLLFFGFFTYNRLSRARKKAQLDILEYQDQLNSRIEELDKANTELIQMKTQEKFAATGRIARTIAHEVRNPLTNITLAAGLLKEELIPKDESAEQLFEMINRNSSRINQLISDLLNSTKFSELHFEKIPVIELLDETLQDAGDRITLGNIQVVKKYIPGCVISGDPDKIKIALLNIILNAIEAMENRDEKVLTLEIRSDKTKCKIIISDTGTGMDKDALIRLFEPYFTSKPAGNGLGLTNTQNIILNHKGEITVESIKGKGTSFSIVLDFV
ncbi:MAG: CHASE3 domain-containing protein [Ferruginibacter sp.]|nr:CHASE3 domain-containing protein [Chitinophagaceae bacterium]